MLLWNELFARFQKTLFCVGVCAGMLVQGIAGGQEPSNNIAEESIRLGRKAKENGQYSSAILLFHKALNQSGYPVDFRSKLEDAMFDLATSYVASDRPELALQTLLLLNDHSPSRLDAFRLRAGVHRSLGQHRAEREALIRCMELNPSDWTVRLALAKAFLDSPECSASDAGHVIAILLPLIQSDDPATDTLEVYESLAHAASLAESWELASVAVRRAVLKASEEDRGRLLQYEAQIERRQSLKTPVPARKVMQEPADVRDWIFAASLSIHLEGEMRFTGKNADANEVQYPVTRDMPAVVVGGHGELLVSSKLMELPTDEFPDHRIEWVRTPVLTVRSWNHITNQLELVGEASVYAIDTAVGLGLLSLYGGPDVDPLTGIRGLRTARIAEDYYFLCRPENARYHYLCFQTGDGSPKVRSVDEGSLLMQLMEDQVPAGTPLFNDQGELVAVAQFKPANIGDGTSEPKLSLKWPNDCSYGYACLAAYSRIPRKVLPFQWRIVPLPEGDRDSVHAYGMEVTNSAGCENLHTGDVIIEVNSVPVTERLDVSLMQNLFHDLQVQELGLKLTDGRTVTEKFAERDQPSVIPESVSTETSSSATPAEDVREVTGTLPELPTERLVSRTEMSNDDSQFRAFEEWLHGNIRDPQLSQKLMDSYQVEKNAGRNYLIQCGSLACRNQQAWIVALHNGNFAAIPVSERLAEKMEMTPDVVRDQKNGKTVSQGDRLFRISMVQITPFQAEGDPSEKGRKLRIRFRLETLSAPEREHKYSLCLETGKGTFRSMTELERLPDVGEGRNYELLWPNKEVPGVLAEADLLILQMYTLENGNPEIVTTCSDCLSLVDFLTASP